MAYKVLDLYKDLPKTNCKECGKPGCFPFATAVCLEGLALDLCPYLSKEELARIGEKLARQRVDDQSRGGDSVEQALAFLRGEMKAIDLKAGAQRCGGTHVAGASECIRLKSLGRWYDVTRADVVGESDNLTAIEKVFFFIYVTRASGAKAAGRWVAMRELPNSTSKAGQFEQQADKIATRFDGRFDVLVEKARSLGGERVSSESADVAVKFQALPRVDILLLLWEGDEDFPARASLLLDEGVLAYLDQEAIVFLAESLTNRLATREGE